MALLVTACKPSPSPLEPAEFCEEFARVQCERLASCKIIAEGGNDLCVSDLTSRCQKNQEELTEGWRFLPDEAERCLEQLPQEICHRGLAECYEKYWNVHPRYGVETFCQSQAFLWRPESCYPYELRPAALGGSCHSDSGCAEGYCGRPRPSDDFFFWGYCVPASEPRPGEIGEPCGEGSCQSDHCDPSTQRCGYRPLGEECDHELECGPDAYCKGYRNYVVIPPAQPNQWNRGVCTPRIPDGGACVDEQWDDGCRAGAFNCLGGTCVQVEPYSLELGAECDFLEQCRDGLTCSTNDEKRGECVPFDPPHKYFDPNQAAP
ncbi:hypothetical protein NR798_26605 [Archangium gephyra]|uniref:hypothetical protein n=1 Tax=Archangium gephyra TaxID=48 RepID=UPI0035D49259